MDSVASQFLAWMAQAQTATAPAATGAPESPIKLWMVIALIAVFYYFLMHKPMQREKAKAAEQLDSMVKGAAVITAGGIHGKIESVDKEGGTVTVTVAPKISIKFNRASIATVKPRAEKADKSEKVEEAAAE